MLRRLPDFEVFTVNSGAEAIKATRDLNPNVIVLDLMMPGITGWEVCRTIRTFSQVPILVLSAVVDSEMVMQSLEEGANDYLVKPVPRGVLISHIKNLVQ
jgi:DNA-binding response OmpR family regulator